MVVVDLCVQYCVICYERFKKGDWVRKLICCQVLEISPIRGKKSDSPENVLEKTCCQHSHSAGLRRNTSTVSQELRAETERNVHFVCVLMSPPCPCPCLCVSVVHRTVAGRSQALPLV